MKKPIDPFHPIRLYFVDALQRSLRDDLGVPQDDTVENYLVDLLLQFVHSDELYAIRGNDGRPLRSVAEMLMESDVALNADSFAREREVNKHIGDFAMFYAGFFPEAIGNQAGAEALIDYSVQGSSAYYIVSTFDHEPFSDEAPMFRRLSEGFETYRYSLRVLRASFQGFASLGYGDGFQA